MQDRYLFRAKRIDNGEWLEWNVIQPDKESAVYLVDTSIDSSTICQCTGLKDKNGKLIFENDIMAGHLDDIFPENVTYVRVMWHKNGFYTCQNYFTDLEPIDEFDQKFFEVCGNIFDNPELLEQEG